MAAEPGRLRPFALVASGAFVGAVCRYLLAVALPGAFPWGTLAANVLGAFALGALTASERSRTVSLAAGTGFCSSFTTYSTFAVETVSLPPAVGGAYAGLTYAAGLAAVVLGRRAVANAGAGA